MKSCGRCKLELPIEAFGKNKATIDGLQHRCKTCRREEHQESVSDPDKRANFNLKRVAYMKTVSKDRKDKRNSRLYKARVGVSKEEREAIFLAQGSLCIICKNSIDLEKEGMLDHNHHCCETDKMCGKCVRGVLCKKCNLGLGLFNDDPTTLRVAADYVESGGTNAVLAATIVRLESDIEEYNNGAVALGHLKAALEALNERTRDREDRNVEGTHTI